jgi:hypothetical protein
VTSFSLLRKGSITQFAYNDFSKGISINGDYCWPNEVSSFRDHTNQLVMLIPDGFLMPGQNDGALYAVRNPNKRKSIPIRITASKPGWFYHRAVYVELINGKKGILTARAHKPLFGEGKGELLWINLPDNIQENWWDSEQKSPKPWTETVLVEGPDVMFEILNRDSVTGCLRICAAHFFGKKLSVHTLQPTSTAPYIKVVESSSMDTIGRPYGLCLTSMPLEQDCQGNEFSKSSSGNSLKKVVTGSSRRREKQLTPKYYSDHVNTAAIVNSYSPPTSDPTHILVSTHECSYDVPKALQMAWSAITGQYPRIKTGESGFQIGERSVVERSKPNNEEGGALFAYEIPAFRPTESLSIRPTEIHTDRPTELSSSSSGDSIQHWQRHTLFRGFKVRGWGGIFSPGAPGFPYVFKMPNSPNVRALVS